MKTGSMTGKTMAVTGTVLLYIGVGIFIIMAASIIYSGVAAWFFAGSWGEKISITENKTTTEDGFTLEFVTQGFLISNIQKHVANEDRPQALVFPLKVTNNRDSGRFCYSTQGTHLVETQSEKTIIFALRYYDAITHSQLHKEGSYIYKRHYECVQIAANETQTLFPYFTLTDENAENLLSEKKYEVRLRLHPLEDYYQIPLNQIHDCRSEKFVTTCIGQSID